MPSPTPRIPQTLDVGLMICLRLEDQPMAVHDFDEDAATVEAVDHVALVDVTDSDSLIVFTDSGARFRVSIVREQPE